MNQQTEFLSALNSFADFLSTYYSLLAKHVPTLGQYEADVAAGCLAMLALRNSWAIHDLAVRNVAYYPAGAVCGRSVFELGAVASWLLVPDDPFDREGRWLGWLKANERFYEKLANDLASRWPELSKAMSKTASHHEKWRTSIQAKLPRGEVKVKPDMATILGELGYAHLYIEYRTVSQIIHAEPDSIQLVHKVEYVPKDSSAKDDVFEATSQTHHYGEFADESDWDTPIRMAVWGMTMPLARLLHLVASTDDDLLLAKQNAVYERLETLKSKRRAWLAWTRSTL